MTKKTYRFRLVLVHNFGFRTICDYPNSRDANAARERRNSELCVDGGSLRVERYLVQP